MMDTHEVGTWHALVQDTEFVSGLLSLKRREPMPVCESCSLRRVSRTFRLAVALACPRAYVVVHPKSPVLTAWNTGVAVAASWVRIVRVEIAPWYGARIDASLICSMLRRCCKLESLVLRNVYLGAANLLRVLWTASIHKSLRLVDLEGTGSDHMVAWELMQLFPRICNLRVLILAANSLYGVSSTILAQGLRQCVCLEHLDLSANGLGEAECGTLCRALRENTALSSFVLSKNMLRRSSLQELVGLIETSPQLRDVDISDNCLGDREAAFLAEALPRTARLETLVLANNSIYQAGALALARGLEQGVGLRRLDVSNNYIDVAGIEALQRAACSRPGGPTEIDVRGNPELSFLCNGDTGFAPRP